MGLFKRSLPALSLWSDSGDRPTRPVTGVAPGAAEIAENPILRTDDANYEIRGLESWEEGKTMAKASRAPGMVSEKKLGSTHLQEIGRVNGIGPGRRVRHERITVRGLGQFPPRPHPLDGLQSQSWWASMSLSRAEASLAKWTRPSTTACLCRSGLP